jgi:D-cysteine desulfhydrase
VADRLAAALGLASGRLWIKRDDLLGLAGGGNKARKLEFSVGAAVTANADVLVTGGAAQSNHIRMTAAAAARLGLDVVAVMTSDAPTRAEGNVLLETMFDIELRWIGPHDFTGLSAAIEATAAELRAVGRRPFAIPVGGSSAIADQGYVNAAAELERLDGEPLVVVAAASGGTAAGLSVGLHRGRVLAVDVGGGPNLPHALPGMAERIAATAGRPAPQRKIEIDQDHIGDHYGALTDGARNAVRLAARTEGLLLDPIYTGKALAALAARAAAGQLPDNDPIVFWHTGGLPGLFTDQHAAWLTGTTLMTGCRIAP